MAIINRVANGFLSLLGTRSQGVSPPNIEEVVTPTVEMDEFYYGNLGYEQIDGATLTVGVGVIGFQSAGAIEVPAGEMWRVLSISVSAFAAAVNTQARIAIAFQNVPNPGALATIKFDSTEFATPVPNSLYSSSITFPVPLIFRSGVILGAFTEYQIVGAADYTISALINRLQV